MVGVTVRVDKKHRAQFDKIQSQLEAAGLHDSRPLPRFLMITGKVDRPDVVHDLSQIEGVESIREGQTFQTQG